LLAIVSPLNAVNLEAKVHSDMVVKDMRALVLNTNITEVKVASIFLTQIEWVPLTAKIRFENDTRTQVIFCFLYRINIQTNYWIHLD